MIKAFWYKNSNFGDTLTKPIVEHFTGHEVVFAERFRVNKLLAVGSIMNALRDGDTVWGAGVLREVDKSFRVRIGCTFLAVRGPLSEKALDKKIGVYGDPALLLPLIYNPDIKQKYEVGYTPHYIDKKMFPAKLLKDNELFIDVQDDWRSIVKNIKSCKKIVSSSLHGIIVAEAYGIPAEWVEYSDKVIGKGFKFRDYFLGTGRVIDKPGNIQPMENLKEVQEKLLAALTSHYKKS